MEWRSYWLMVLDGFPCFKDRPVWNIKSLFPETNQSRKSSTICRENNGYFNYKSEIERMLLEYPLTKEFYNLNRVFQMTEIPNPFLHQMVIWVQKTISKTEMFGQSLSFIPSPEEPPFLVVDRLRMVKWRILLKYMVIRLFTRSSRWVYQICESELETFTMKDV